MIEKSRMIADPLRLYDCSPNADGAAAVVLGPAEIAHKFNSCVIEVIGCSQASGFSNLYEIGDLTTMSPTVYAAKTAFSMAGLRPADVDVVELYDCFTIAEIISSEDLGFFEKGYGARALENGLTEVEGKLPINPSGGLISKGHPAGTSGLGQIYELVKQLRGQHENQIGGAKVGLTHYYGATSQISTVAILRRKD
jgi:acetyl-CoA C-acetyltransferase